MFGHTTITGLYTRNAAKGRGGDEIFQSLLGRASNISILTFKSLGGQELTKGGHGPTSA